MLGLALSPGIVGPAAGLAALSVGVSTLLARSCGSMTRSVISTVPTASDSSTCSLRWGPLLAGSAYDLGGPLLAYSLATAAILGVTVVVAGVGAAAPTPDAEVDGRNSLDNRGSSR
jgi:hypothetical protein